MASGQIVVNQGTVWRKIVVGVYVAIGTAIIMGGWAMVAHNSPQTGWDFPVFYIAAHLPTHLLYNRDAFAAFWQLHLAPIGVRYSPPFYIRPSIFSFLYRPMIDLSYWHAFWIWASAGLIAYFAGILVLLRRFHLPALLLPAYAAFFPALAGLISGQDNCFYFFVVIAALTLLEQRKEILAGVAIALCLYKFNLIFLVPLMLLFHRRFKALASFMVAACLIVAGSVLLASSRDYLRVLTEGPKEILGFFPVGLRGFSHAIKQPWCYPVLAVLVFIVCCRLIKILPVTEAFAVAVTGALLISPYITWYDSTLLALPIAMIFARGAVVVRSLCVAVLAAVPLWEHGGGNNGPIGFTHVGVELLILAYFIHAASALNNLANVFQLQPDFE